jgi:hypothetical protein
MKLPAFLKKEIKLSKPDFKLRKGSSPKPKPEKVAKAAKVAKPKVAKPKRQIPVPGFAENLYRDMRDRRLLLPALGLIVAIVAVPLFLMTPKEAPPSAAAVAAPEGADAVSPAVLTEQPVGVRDYRERLDELKSKNPFADDFSFPAEGEATTDPVAVDSGPGSTGPTTTDVPSAPPTETGGTTPPTPPTDTGSEGGTGASTEQELLLIEPRIDVRGGPVGERKRIKDVAPGDLVPSARHAPIAMFVAASSNLEDVTFVISQDVTETDGDGKCRPRASHCEFLTLREDEKRYFTFGPDAKRYSLKITDIREKVVDRRKVEGANAPSGTG